MAGNQCKCCVTDFTIKGNLGVHAKPKKISWSRNKASKILEAT
jgi:hypothetical protein